MMIANK